MRRLFLMGCLVGLTLVPASCWTVYRYSRCESEEGMIDEKNRDREDRINRRFYGIIPGSDYPRRWRR